MFDGQLTPRGERLNVRSTSNIWLFVCAAHTADQALKT